MQISHVSIENVYDNFGVFCCTSIQIRLKFLGMGIANLSQLRLCNDLEGLGGRSGYMHAYS